MCSEKFKQCLQIILGRYVELIQHRLTRLLNTKRIKIFIVSFCYRWVNLPPNIFDAAYDKKIGCMWIIVKLHKNRKKDYFRHFFQELHCRVYVILCAFQFHTFVETLSENVRYEKVELRFCRKWSMSIFWVVFLFMSSCKQK